MKRYLLAVLLLAGGWMLLAEQAHGQYYYRSGFSGVYGPAYYNTYRPYYSYRPAYPGYMPYQPYNPALNYYGPYPRYYGGPQYFVPYRAWGAAPGAFYGGGFYLY